jgi:hypothetical protein
MSCFCRLEEQMMGLRWAFRKSFQSLPRQFSASVHLNNMTYSCTTHFMILKAPGGLIQPNGVSITCIPMILRHKKSEMTISFGCHQHNNHTEAQLHCV